jgi:hypothetical protein
VTPLRPPILYRLAISFALLLLASISVFYFPGVTWLQSDTQIYVPIFEHIDDPALLAKDPIAIHPHVSWTLYDETAILARRWFGLAFQQSLGAVQFLTRLAGIGGVFLLARSLALSPWASLLVAGCFALGAVINGPAVLTLEYEPVPRGFAVQLVFGALGLAACRRWLLAGIAGGLALLFHPPTSAPFWGCLLLFWVFSEERPRIRAALYALGGAIALATLARLLQHGEVERQSIFGRIDPFLEQVQRLRGAYNWIGQWPQEWLWQYPLLFAAAALAWWRLRPAMSSSMAWFSIALPVYGMLTVPAQAVLLDQWRWIFLPQFQPARAVLFITAFAIILGAAAGWRAAATRRWGEAAGWFLLVYTIPANGLVAPLFTSLWTEPLARRRAAAILLCAVAAALAAYVEGRTGRGFLAAAAIAVPLFLLPGWAEVQPFPRLHHAELDQLADWASRNTRQDEVFLFADAGRQLAPGIFRAQARRALFVDWKGGGQVNLWRSFAADWRQRWFEQARECRPPLRPGAEYRDMGIRYLVLQPDTAFAERPPVYANARYRVFDLYR